MKKVFNIKVENKTPERQLDAIKHEIKKYLARERRKKIPKDFDYWDFECKIGQTAESAESIHVSQINDGITKVAQQNTESFYMEIFAKAMNRIKE